MKDHDWLRRLGDHGRTFDGTCERYPGFTTSLTRQVKSLGDAIQFAGDRCAGTKVQTLCRQRPVRPSSAPIATATRCRSMCPSFHMGGYVRQDHLDRYQDREGPCRPKDGCRASQSLSSRNQASLDHFQLTAPIHIDQRILKMTLRSDVVREVVGDVDQRCARHCWRSAQQLTSDLVCLGLSTARDRSDRQNSQGWPIGSTFLEIATSICPMCK